MQKILDKIIGKIKIIDLLMIAFVSLCAIAIRLIFLDYESPDYILCFKPWYDQMDIAGGLKGLSYKFDKVVYPPIYMTLLALLTYLPVNSLYSIKFLTFIFDFVLAIVSTFFFCERYKKVAIYSMMLFLPTVVLNGALWGQCDSIYVSFLLLSLLLLYKCDTRGKYGFLSIFFFAIAFCFKLQSVFFFPILALYVAKDKIKIRYFLMVPLFYLLSCIIPMVNGASFIELIKIYFYQVNASGEWMLTLGFQNIYSIIGNIFVEYFGIASIIFAFILVCLILYYCYYKGIKNSSEYILVLSFTICATITFILPHMHERYGYFIDILSVIYALKNPRNMWVMVVTVTCSFVSYLLQFTSIQCSELVFAFARAGVLLYILRELYTLSNAE